ncbi:MAG: GldG family protein [Elusimicrobia bacterium]|nr:GldG family protein [Elusimicrobiota bacterium]
MIPVANNRKVQLSLVSGTGLLLVLGALAFLNLLGDRFFIRFDWTADHRYSLSRASLDLVKSLEDPVIARFYLTPGLPQPYESQGRYIRDLLQEYQTASRGKFSVETIAPDKSEETLMEFNRLNLRPARFTQVGSDQFQVREGYMGLVLHYQDKQDVIPFVKEVDNLEYEISSRLRVMSQKGKKILFFISNHNEVSPEFIKQGPAGRLFDEFRVETTRLSKEGPGMKPDVVFLLGPKSPMTPEELDALDNYVASGVPLVAALNRRVVFPDNLRSIAQATGLEPFLEHYGVQVERDFVMDDQCRNITMQDQQTIFPVKYYPLVMANDLNRQNRSLQSIDVLGFPYASALTPTLAPPSALTFTWLARSSKKSWIWPGFYNVDPVSIFNQLKTDSPSDFSRAGRQKDLGPFTLAALVEGSTVTFRDPSRPAPRVKLVVMGTSFFANPQMPNPDGNALFILSMAQWLTQEGNYLTIPPKSSPYRPLKPVPGWVRAVFKGFGYFLVPFLVLLGGVWHWRNRSIGREGIRAAFLRPRSPHA